MLAPSCRGGNGARRTTGTDRRLPGAACGPAGPRPAASHARLKSCAQVSGFVCFNYKGRTCSWFKKIEKPRTRAQRENELPDQPRGRVGVPPAAPGPGPAPRMSPGPAQPGPWCQVPRGRRCLSRLRFLVCQGGVEVLVPARQWSDGSGGQCEPRLLTAGARGARRPCALSRAASPRRAPWV